MREEIKKEIMHLKNRNVVRPDLIPPEALKADIHIAVEGCRTYLELYRSKKWYQSIPKIKIPKIGNQQNCENYRGISLS